MVKCKVDGGDIFAKHSMELYIPRFKENLW